MLFAWSLRSSLRPGRRENCQEVCAQHSPRLSHQFFTVAPPSLLWVLRQCLALPSAGGYGTSLCFLTLILKKLEKITLFNFTLSSSCWCLWLISLKLANNNIQLTLEQHGLELRGSTHTWIPSPYDTSTPSSIVWIPRSEPGIRKVNCKLHVGLPSWLRW